MKKLIILAILSGSFFACNQKSASDIQAQKTIDNTDHDLDSINKRFDRIKKLMDAGMSEEEATNTVNNLK